MHSDLAALHTRVATACRILARAGLVEGILGHVSMRVDAEHLLVRCRGPRERGLLFTEVNDIRLVELDGEGDLGEYSVPNELALHAETLRARPDVSAVVHAHPRAVVTADLAGVDLEPVVGAFDIPAARLAQRSIPVYPRGVLIRRAELAHEMLAAMGDAPVCVLRGHGLTSVGESLEQAVASALAVDDLARISLEVARCGAKPQALPAADLGELPDLGSGFNDRFTWQFHEMRLRHEGLGLEAAPAGEEGDL